MSCSPRGTNLAVRSRGGSRGGAAASCLRSGHAEAQVVVAVGRVPVVAARRAHVPSLVVPGASAVDPVLARMPHTVRENSRAAAHASSADGQATTGARWVSGDDAIAQPEQASVGELSPQHGTEDAVSDAGETCPYVELDVPGEPSHVLLRPQHGHHRALALPARERVGQERASTGPTYAIRA